MNDNKQALISLFLNSDDNVCFTISAKELRMFLQEIVRQELFELLELVKADRENLIETSYSVYLKAKSLEELDFNTNEIVKVLKNQEE